jgi:hypothetical protein
MNPNCCFLYCQLIWLAVEMSYKIISRPLQNEILLDQSATKECKEHIGLGPTRLANSRLSDLV